MNIFVLSQPSLYVGALLLHATPPRAERNLCYFPFVGSYLPYPPKGSNTLRHRKALRHPVAGSRVGLTKQ